MFGSPIAPLEPSGTVAFRYRIRGKAGGQAGKRPNTSEDFNGLQHRVPLFRKYRQTSGITSIGVISDVSTRIYGASGTSHGSLPRTSKSAPAPQSVIVDAETTNDLVQAESRSRLDTHCLSLNIGTQFWPQCLFGHEVHRATQCAFQIELHAEILLRCRRSIERDNDVHIAVQSRLITHARTE